MSRKCDGCIYDDIGFTELFDLSFRPRKLPRKFEDFKKQFAVTGEEGQARAELFDKKLREAIAEVDFANMQDEWSDEEQ